jgi:hypothetical protein
MLTNKSSPSHALRRLRLIGTVLALSFLPTFGVRADAGPGPQSMEFTFQFKSEPIEIVHGQLLECTDAACQTFTVFQGHFDCKGTYCNSWVTRDPSKSGKQTGYSQYHILSITFADKTRQSNVFAKRHYDDSYQVVVSGESLDVQEISSSDFIPKMLIFFLGAVFFLPALALTLLVELVTAAIYFKITKLKASLWWVVAANILSLPVVWFVIPNLGYPILNGNYSYILVICAELFAFVFETLFLFITSMKKGLTLLHALLLSFLMNLASFGLGALAFIVITRVIK